MSEFVSRLAGRGLVTGLLLASAAGASNPRVFVTSTIGSGDLSSWAETDSDGLAGANQICQARADAETLGGTWKAWISTDGTDAYCNLMGLTGTKPACGAAHDPSQHGPWVRMDGTPFAGDLAEMTGSEHLVYQAVRYDETGTVLADLEFAVWTATNPNGTQEGTTCSDWSSTTGSAYTGVGTYVGRDWTEYVSLGCADDEIRLSCFETGDGDPLDWPREPGALAFLTTVKGSGKLSTWADAGGESGIDAGDEVCRARAEAAFLPLPESFVAWLSDGAEDAKDRVTVDGPFVRVDGFLFAASEAAMLGNDADIRTGLNVTELETYYVQPHLGGNVWTGTFYAGEVALEHCLDWESELDTEGGNSGNSAAARFDWHHNGVPFCHVARPIYCFSNVELLAWDNFERGDLHRWTSDSSGP